MTLTVRRVHESLLPWKSNKFLYISARARARVCVGARAYACARVALLIQYAMRRHTAIGGPSGSTLSQKRHDFRRNVTKHKMCVLILFTTFI